MIMSKRSTKVRKTKKLAKHKAAKQQAVATVRGVPPEIGGHILRIRASWQKAVSSILETGTELIELKAAAMGVGKGWWEKIFERKLLPFGITTAQRVMAVACNPCLAKPAHMRLLPPSWGTLYLLSRLDQSEIERRLRDGSIHPGLEAKEIKMWHAANVAERCAKIALDAEALGKFPIVYADPPWRYEGLGVTNSRTPEKYYPLMSVDEICALPVGDIVHDDAVLFMWVTNAHLPGGLKVIEAWGFEYVANMIWDKETIGNGYYVRNQHEILLIAKRGNMSTPTEANRPPSLYRERRPGKHSEKPVAFHEIIEKMYPDLPRIELFARAVRPGWTSWGNQLPQAEAAAA
jgi:N6-adenosine-specific RNA methylase IME4